MYKPWRSILAAVLLVLILPDIADIDLLEAQDRTLGTSMQDYMADSGVRNVYQECSHNNWPIMARLGNLRQIDPLPSKSILYLFVKNNTVDIHSEYFRTPQGRYVLLISFPAAVVDKALSDFIRK
jgi:hypothetical protein